LVDVEVVADMASTIVRERTKPEIVPKDAQGTRPAQSRRRRLP
jgi:hypothetical protein